MLAVESSGLGIVSLRSGVTLGYLEREFVLELSKGLRNFLRD